MSRYSDQVRDPLGRLLPGTKVYVYDWDVPANATGDLETLFDDDLSTPLANPLITDEFGEFYFNSANGLKLLEFHFGGKLQYREQVLVGPQPTASLGGTVVDIDLFTNASLFEIPAGVNTVQTSGHGVQGKGHALYVYDAAVDAAYVTANPRSSFRSLGTVSNPSRGFRIADDQDITPQMLGADGTTDDSPAFAAAVAVARTQSGSAQVGVVPVPSGMVYAFDNLAGDVQNVGFIQVAPRYQGDTQPGWAADGTLYGSASKPPNVWWALEGRMDRGSGSEDDTQAAMFVGVHGDTSNSDVSFIKMGGYFRYRQNDPSNYVGTPINRDGVALGGFGVIAAGNLTGRVWGGYLDVRVEATADGLATGLEIDCFNAGPTQNTLDTTTSKYGLRVVASSGRFTAAMKVDSATGADSFYYGFAINPAALSAGGAAIYMNGLFALMKTGAVGIGTSTPEANVTLHLVSSGSTKLLVESDGANESLATFRDTGTNVWSAGINNASGEFRITNAETLGSAVAFALSLTTLDAAFGGNVNVVSGKVYKVNGNQVVGARGAAVARISRTATSGSLPTPDGSITIANTATPTVVELLEYCTELEAKLEELTAKFRAATGHGLIA